MEVAKEKWFKRKHFKKVLTFSAQEQALKMDYLNFHIAKTGESPLCRISKVEKETVSHIVSQCKMLAQK